MPDVDGEKSDFDQLDELFEEGSAEGEADEEDLAADQADDSASADEAEPKKKKGKSKKKAKAKSARKEKKTKLRKSDGKEVEEEEEEAQAGVGGLLVAVTKADPYTVMLGLTLLAVVIAIFCLWLELADYGFDIKAEGAKRTGTVVPSAQFGHTDTMAATRSWASRPIDVQVLSGETGLPVALRALTEQEPVSVLPGCLNPPHAAIELPRGV